MSPYRAAPQPHSKRRPAPTMLRLAEAGKARGWRRRVPRWALAFAACAVLHFAAPQMHGLARIALQWFAAYVVFAAMSFIAGYRRVLRVRRAMARGRRMRPCGMCPPGSTARGPVATWPRCPSLRTHDRRERMWARNFEQ